MKHLDELGVAVVDNLTVPQIEFCNLGHVLSAELKVPDVNILFHTLFMDGFRNDDNAALHIPAQCHLRGALAVFLADGCQITAFSHTLF